jgi:hypothetical protein
VLEHRNLSLKMKPRVVMECGGFDLKSTVIQNFEENGNFENPALHLDMVSTTSQLLNFEN